MSLELNQQRLIVYCQLSNYSIEEVDQIISMGGVSKVYDMLLHKHVETEYKNCWCQFNLMAGTYPYHYWCTKFNDGKTILGSKPFQKMVAYIKKLYDENGCLCRQFHEDAEEDAVGEYNAHCQYCCRSVSSSASDDQ